MFRSRLPGIGLRERTPPESPMPQMPLQLSLPRPGPFRLKGGYAPVTMLKAALGLLLLGGLGAGLIFYAYTRVQTLRETAGIWNKGVEARQAGLTGRVTTTNFIFKEYKLTLRYRVADGQIVRRRVNFFRFFTGPGKRDPYKIRYLREQPSKATVSWQYEARIHGWVFVGFLGAIGVILVFVGFAVFRGLVRELLLVKRLARQGELVEAEILDVEEVVNPQTSKTELQFSYRTDRGGGHDGVYKAPTKKMAPMLVNDDKSMVLLIDLRTSDHFVIRHDGHPLAL